MEFFEELEVGTRWNTGAFTFTEADIVRFGKAYDPQYFHTDPLAARDSLFGALAASGWHTAAVFMKMWLAHMQEAERQARAAGVTPATIGPSPGFTDMKWARPVLAGDTLSFSSQVTDKRPLASNPKWGLVFTRNEGINQAGELAFSFNGKFFLERRGQS
jgi:acyl dehydratase